MNKEVLREQFSRQLGLSVPQLEVIPLHSHASYRSYYRALLPDGSTYAIMEIPTGKWSLSEEVTDAALEVHELPYLELSRYLASKGFPVPAVYGADEETGYIILQDLGDQVLEQALPNLSAAEKLQRYREAVTLLVDFQGKTNPETDSCIAFQRQFNEELFIWEFEHFFEYGIEGRLGQTIASSDRECLTETARKIAATLTKLPQVLVHRDYQSRNLMIHEGQLWLIDFQDALRGPITYDLVALLRDSYVVLDLETVKQLINEFLRQQKTRYGKQQDQELFLKMFDWTTIQRKLKDTGRFVFIDREKGNPDFLQYIPTSLQYVKEALLRQEELKEFYARLKNYVPEWQ